MSAYQARISRGDTSAIREWRQRIEDIERRYRVPDELRSKWQRTDTAGAAPIVAFTRKIANADFEVDVVRLGVYLLAVVAATTAAAIIATSRLSA
jgi:hypothetical protein